MLGHSAVQPASIGALDGVRYEPMAIGCIDPLPDLDPRLKAARPAPLLTTARGHLQQALDPPRRTATFRSEPHPMRILAIGNAAPRKGTDQGVVLDYQLECSLLRRGARHHAP